MRKIKITEGQNFSIHVEEKIEKENFFFHEYEMAVKHLNHIWDSQAAFKWKQNDLFIDNPNNIIAFCGERGTGKSSVMISFINALHQSEKKLDEFRFSDAVRNNNWDSKVIIDPSMFDGVHNILDIVLAHIFQSFNDAYQEDNQRFDMYERERLYKLMTKVYKNLSIIKNKEKMLNDEYDEAGNIAKLQKLGESTQLQKTLSELISVYLEMISKVKCRQGQKCEKLLIAVDDLDLCNEYAYEMSEQIRKYLILPNVIIFMAIKIEQLKLGIEEKNRKDFKNVIAGKLNSDNVNCEISDMSQRYLTKLIPTARRILLPDLNNTEFTLEFDGNIKDNESLNYLNAEEIILKMIHEKTGMIFETTIENTYHFFVLENLREFVNFIIFLLGLNTPEKSKQEEYLQNLQDFKTYFINEILKARVSLMATYHVGEDFFDIVDGLRAIDEVMLFCGLYSGCRLGHALALGIDPGNYYKYKGNILVMPGHDLLDNLAWLLVKQSQYGCLVDETLKFSLEHKFNELFNEIYYDRDLEYGSITYLEYYNCWKLRGDYPDNYLLDSKEFVKRLKKEPIRKLQRYEFNPAVSDVLRENSKYRELYMHYHYDVKARKNGEREVKFKVPCGYVELVKDIQDAMIRELVQKGIGIETNPSSNYLISSIQKYNEHPIIRFNGRKLKSTNTNMALQVSINTDDQGVFDTSLENEYALMTIALKKVKNENDQFLYDMEDIYAWIDYVRRMGITQSFKLENSQFERFPFSENIEN